jgi:hypothetical protein
MVSRNAHACVAAARTTKIQKASRIRRMCRLAVAGIAAISGK